MERKVKRFKRAAIDCSGRGVAVSIALFQRVDTSSNLVVRKRYYLVSFLK